jgi:hypothetical protein
LINKTLPFILENKKFFGVKTVVTAIYHLISAIIFSTNQTIMGTFTRFTKLRTCITALLTIVAMLGTTPAWSQCNFTSAFGTATAPAPGATAVTITTCNFGGEYATINSAVAGTIYTFTSSVGTDFLTVRSGTPGGAVLGSGPTPLTITATASGPIYLHVATNASCGTASTCRTTTVAASLPACNFTSAFGTVNAPAPGAAAVTITTCNFGGEYATINNCVAGTSYTFTSSVATDYLTVRQGTPGGTVRGSGTQPLTVTCTVSGPLYLHVATNSSCGTASTCRTTSVSASLPTCNNTSAFGTITAPTAPNSATISTCNFGGEYATINSAVAGTSYTFTSSVATDFLTVRQGTPGGTAIGSGTQPLTVTCTVSGPIYLHVNTNSSCGTQSTCRTTAVTASLPACTNTTSFGNQNVPTTVGGTATISCQFAGEYGTWNNIVAGNTYSISSTNATDYLTVRSGSSNGPVVTAGVQPLSIVAAAAGTWYVHCNTNSTCGTQSTCRDIVTTLTASPCGAPTALTATAITGTTANIGWTPSGPATLWDVYYSTSNTAPIASTTPTIDNTTTNPQALTGLSSGTTYFVWVRSDCGSGITSSWAALPSFNTTILNDDCANASTIVCNTTYSGTTVGSTSDAATAPDCHPVGGGITGVWFKYVGDNNAVTINLCNAGTSYDTKISVFTGTCGAFTCYASNDDLGGACTTGPGTPGFKSGVTFNAYTGTDYYVLVHGYGNTSTGLYSFTPTCAPLCLPVPGNEACASAATYTLSNAFTPTTVSNNCASDDVNPNPGCYSAFATLPDVWYSFTTPANVSAVQLRVDLNGTATTMGYVVYSGTCGGLSQIVCNTTATNGVANAITGLAPSTTYYVEFLSDQSTKGSFDFGIYYESCPSPSNLTTSNLTSTSVNIDWTENGSSSLWDVYYDVNPATVPTAGTTPTLAGLTSHPISLGPLTPNTAYQLWVRSDCGAGDLSAWTGPLNFTTPNPPPANDLCAGAIPIATCGSTTLGSTLDATNDAAGACVTSDGSFGVWYSMVGNGSTVTLSTANTPSLANYNTDTKIHVYEGTCASYNCVTGNDDFSGLMSQVTFNTTVGSTYLILVSEFGTGNGGYNFQLDATCSGLNTWLGNSNDWFDPSNWSNAAVPSGCADDVNIPVAPSSPVIVGATANVGSVTIADGVNIQLQGQNLNVCGNWASGNAGGSSTTNVGGGEVVFNSGAGAQTIDGNTNFQVLTVNNPAGVSVLGTGIVNISEGLHLQNGIFDNSAGGVVTLLSPNETTAAYIDDFSAGFAGEYSGTILAQRGVASGGNWQHFISSPVDAPALSDLTALSGTDGAFVTPSSTCSENQLDATSAIGTAYEWVEAPLVTPGCFMGNWRIRSVGNMDNGRGYSVYLSSGSYDLAGSPNSGSYSVSGLSNSNWSTLSAEGNTFTSGWHLLGNPYPSPLDLNTNHVTSEGFDAQVQVWMPSGPWQGTWDARLMGVDAQVASSQGFQVHNSNVGTPQTFTFTNAERVRTSTSNPAFFQMPNQNALNVIVTGSNGTKDRTRVYFNSDATSAFDKMYDADKLISTQGYPTVYTWMANAPERRMGINTLTDINTTSTVPMAFLPGADATFTVTAEGINTFDPTSYIMLEDVQTGTMHNLRNGGYTFTSTVNDARNRFVLHFTPATVVNTTASTCSNDGAITVEQPGNSVWNYSVTNTQGTILSSGVVNQTTPATVSNLSAGVYTLTLADNNGYTVVKNIQVTGSASTAVSFAAPAGTIAAGQDVTFNNTTADAVNYEWSMGDGTIITGIANPVYSYSTPGQYTVTLTVVNTNGCTNTFSQLVTVLAANGIADLGNGTLNIYSATNKVYVDFSKLKGVEATIEIYNVIGQNLSTEKFGKSTIYAKEIKNLDAAYVIVKVINNGEVITKKVFVANSK